MINTVIFSIEGGLGKSIMATAVLKAIKKAYSKAYIIVITPYPDVFISNPNLNRVLHSSQTMGIYKRYLSKKDAKVFISDPYHHTDFIMEEAHLLKIWCKMYDLEYNNEFPEIFISKAEKEYFLPFYNLEKPIMAIQPNGGGLGQPLRYSWTRDIPVPVVNEVVDYFKEKYSILHIKRDDQMTYENTIGALDNWRSIAIMLSLSKKRLLIDSSSMHISTALNLPSVVAWVTTSKDVFGYDIHKNIIANKPNLEINTEHNYLSKNLLFEDISTFPYDSLESVFDVGSIIKALS